MKRPKFSRFSAAEHFVEGLDRWAGLRRAGVYPEVIPAGVERYPFVTIETNNVQRRNETKDGGTDALRYDVVVTVAVKERKGQSGQETRNELADEVVDVMDGTQGEHNGYKVRSCEWLSGSPGYDEARDCYYMELFFALEAEPPEPVTETAEIGRAVANYAIVGQAED